MKYLEVGKIVTTHGIKGEVKVQVITDNISRFEKGNCLYIGENKEKIIVDSYRIQKNMVLLAFNGITNINDVLKYIDKMLYVDVDEIRDDEEIYYDDLIDCVVKVDEEEKNDGSFVRARGCDLPCGCVDLPSISYIQRRGFRI